ncbi:MAG: hypothetical protein JST16_02975 [Bdellovibrionales bacterium]|nr:hypothetical protein [Bdellovibrionales bacterium]
MWATPQVIRVDGSVFDSAGAPVTAGKDIQIKAYDAATAGTLLWTSSVYNTSVSSGRFTINLDAAAGSPSLVDRLGERTASQAVYFQIEVDSGAANGSMDSATIVLPRIRAKGTAFALNAVSADAIKGVTATAGEINFLAGATANVQTQINAKMATVSPGTSGNILTSNGTSWVSSAPSASSGGGSMRQTVLNGSVDSNGSANFLSAGSGLAVNLAATSTPVVLSFSDGFDSTGAVEKLAVVSSDVSSAWSSLPASSTVYLYVDRNSSNGSLSYGYSTSKPQYAPYQPSGVAATPTMTSNTAPSGTVTEGSSYNASYLGWKAFNKTTVDNNDAWCTASGVTASTLGYQFPSAKVISSYSVQYRNYSDPLEAPKDWTFQGSSNGSSWTTLDTRSSETGWSQNQKRSYTVSSPASYAYYRLNITNNNGTASAIICVGEVELKEIVSNWFDMAAFKFKSWNGSSWDAVQRLFVGEAVTGASSVSSVTTYALRGYYESPVFSVAAASFYTKNHNLGVEPLDTFGFVRQSESYSWKILGHAYAGGNYGGDLILDRLTVSTGFTEWISYGGGDAWGGTYAFSSGAATSGEAKIVVRRGW